MAALTATDINARQVMVTLAYHLVGRADHPVALAEEMSEFFAAVARMQRSARVEPLRKKPSGEFRAATELLREAMPNATAPTSRVDTSELLATIIREEESKP